MGVTSDSQGILALKKLTVHSINPNRPGGWHNMPQKFHLNLILLAIVHRDGDQTIFSHALLDADFGPLGRNQHPARRGKILFDCHPDVRLRVK